MASFRVDPLLASRDDLECGVTSPHSKYKKVRRETRTLNDDMMKPTVRNFYIFLAPCFGALGWQVLVFNERGQCILGSAHPTKAEASLERRRLIRSLQPINKRKK